MAISVLEQVVYVGNMHDATHITLIIRNYDLRPTIFFLNILQPPQNYRCQKGDMKQVTQLGPTTITRHSKKFKQATWCPGPEPLIMTIHFTAVPYDGLLNFVNTLEIRNCERQWYVLYHTITLTTAPT
jgi:hypothetical protein